MKFSIIIPVYNVAPYLRECLDSVMNQTFSDWEAICVDDGSTDESAGILDEYAAKDKRFVVAHQSNAGVSRARNAALELARGEYIGFLDADDLLSLSCLFSLSRAVEEWPDIVSFNNLLFKGVASSCQVGCDCSFKILRWHEFTVNGYHKRGVCQMFCRRDIVGQERFIAGMEMGEDREFQSRMFARAELFSVCDEDLYLTRAREGSATRSQMTAKKFSDAIRAAMLGDANLKASNKKCTPADVRFGIRYLTEFASIDYFRLPCKERADVKPTWDIALQAIRKSPKASLWFRFASSLALMLDYDLVRFVLFRLPVWLKQKGVRR